MIKENKTYNGWSNYATWRVNLEYFDGYCLTEERDLTELICELKECAYYYVEDAFPPSNYPSITTQNNYVKGWAHAFVDEVNYFEIATNLILNYKENK